MMVRVSRGAGEPAGFLACVADGAESIEGTSAKAAASAAEQDHCTPKRGAAGNEGGEQASGREISERMVGRRGGRREDGGAESRDIPLDSSRCNKYYTCGATWRTT